MCPFVLASLSKMEIDFWRSFQSYGLKKHLYCLIVIPTRVVEIAEGTIDLEPLWHIFVSTKLHGILQTMYGFLVLLAIQADAIARLYESSVSAAKLHIQVWIIDFLYSRILPRHSLFPRFYSISKI